MRKDSGFEVMDNINLYVAGNSVLEDVVRKYEDTIKHDTLAVNVLYDEANKEYVETPINGEKLNIFVEVVK
jgi:isoleucyl-tRNA synthetase